MVELQTDECRVLGVLIEKAQTTPAQYPLTLNALVNGANQKNNRHPVTSLTEDRVFAALDGLRGKGLAREVDMAGSRVSKFRHVAREALGVSTQELVVLAELLLRGPQSVGELRGRASRMFPLESLEVVRNALDSMMQREAPLVRNAGRAPGSRAERYAQLLCPGLHRLDEVEGGAGADEGGFQGDEQPSAFASELALMQRVERLEAEVTGLREELDRLRGRG